MEVGKDLKWSRIKSGTPVTKEAIEAEISYLQKLKTEKNNENLASKVILNSIYGVLGFKPFILYNRDVAETVTTQSRTLIKFTIQIMNKYFKEFYHLDKNLLEKLKLESVEPARYNVINYADTDSVMLYLDRIYDASGYKPSVDLTIAEEYGVVAKEGDVDSIKLELYLKIYHYGLRPYIKAMLENFCDNFNAFQTKPSGQPSFKLTLEQINYSVLWLAKKLYIKNTSWGGKIMYKPLTKLSYKGIDVNKRTIPKFVRGKMEETIKYIMSTQGMIDNTKLISTLRSVKEQFTTIDDMAKISFYQKINNYNKYVLNDTTEIKLADGCPAHVRAAAIYNFLLYNSKYKGRYSFIKSGMRIQYYQVADPDLKVFGYLPGAYPAEFALPIDMDAQYTKIYLDPMNNILEVLGVPSLSSDLLLFPGIW